MKKEVPTTLTVLALATVFASVGAGPRRSPCTTAATSTTASDKRTASCYDAEASTRPPLFRWR
jgi:hypothetical protein